MISLSGEDQYLDLCKRILNEGVMVPNERTGKNTLTVINADLVYDVGSGDFPLVTTRKSFYRSAIMELVGYLRGYTSAEDFRSIGVKTWDANANENEAWLKNPHRKGKDDMGRVYGAQMRNWQGDIGRKPIDQLMKVVSDLANGIDNRGEMLMMWNPGEFHLGCLRPCLYNWQFSILGNELHLHAYQRSCDVPLGLNFNMVQVYFMLVIMARITGLKPGKAYHKIVNAHIYEDQIELMKTQVKRTPFNPPTLEVNQSIETIEDLLYSALPEDFLVLNYKHHEAINYPFSV